MSAAQGYFENLLLLQRLRSKISCSDSCSHVQSILRSGFCAVGPGAQASDGATPPPFTGTEHRLSGPTVKLVFAPVRFQLFNPTTECLWDDGWDVLISNSFRIFLTSSLVPCSHSLSCWCFLHLTQNKCTQNIEKSLDETQFLKY